MKSAQNRLSANLFWRAIIASVVIAVFYSLTLIHPSHVLGQSNNNRGYESSYSQDSSTNVITSSNTNPDVPINFHSVIQIVAIETLSAGVCQLAGFDPLTPDHKCLGYDSKTGKIGFVENGGGAIAVMGALIDTTFYPPASSTQYIAYLKNNFGIQKSTYAANPDANVNPCAIAGAGDNRGVGFCSLLPILPLWEAMRNIVYLIIILVFVVIGIGIMLRIHIDPRTVMTIQNQIPKIIIGIIAITFSFAIAGLLIDVMWVAIYLFAGVITTATNTQELLSTIVQAGNPFKAVEPIGIIEISTQTGAAFSELITSVFNDPNNIIISTLGGLISLVAMIIIFIAILVALLRLWVMLVITYINIILDVVFAPWWILAGLLPGSSMGVGAWLRDLIANLSVFPVAIGFFLLANYFVDAFSDPNGIADTLTPPLLGGTNSAAISALIGLGFILMLPNLLTTMKAALKAPKLNFGPIMGPVGVGGKIVGGGPKRFASGVVNEMTRVRYQGEDKQAAGGWRRAVRVMRGH